jgi:competence protein ComEA
VLDDPLPPPSGPADPVGAAAPGAAGRLAALTGRSLPALPPARLDPGRRGVAALAAVAVAALLLTGAVVWRARPRPVDLAPPPVVTAPSAAAAALVVDVAGDVRRPGLVRLPAGSRVADAIAAAGGLRPGATTEGLNLARRLTDGEQVLVGAAPSGAPAAAASPGLVNLNTATAEDLDALPGVGPVLAERIVAWRDAHGPFASVDQLREVSGIGERKFADLRDRVTV